MLLVIEAMRKAVAGLVRPSRLDVGQAERGDMGEAAALDDAGDEAGDVVLLGEGCVGGVDLGEGGGHAVQPNPWLQPFPAAFLPWFVGNRRRMGRAKRAAAEPAAQSTDDDALLSLLAAGLRLQADDALWRVSGNTLPHRTLLRDAGGTWNRLDQCWEFAGEDPTAKLAAAIEATPAAAGHNSGAPAAAAAALSRPSRPGARAGAEGRHRVPARLRAARAAAVLCDRADRHQAAGQAAASSASARSGDIFAAEPAQLREFEIDQRTLVLFRAVRESGRRLAERKVKDMPVLTNWQQLIDYCHAALAHEKTEQFRILFLDRKNVLIADEVQQRGTIDHTPVYPREVIKRALELGAAALILVHNHPSGDPKPSREDIEMTKEIRKAAEALGISIHDHLVIGRKGHASFRSLGLL